MQRCPPIAGRLTICSPTTRNVEVCLQNASIGSSFVHEQLEKFCALTISLQKLIIGNIPEDSFQCCFIYSLVHPSAHGPSIHQ